MEWCEEYGLKFSTLRHRLDNLGLPFEIAITMDGLPRVNYNGKEITIRSLAQRYNIDYKYFIHEVLINKKSAEEVISDDQTRQSIQRMIQQMNQG